MRARSAIRTFAWVAALSCAGAWCGSGCGFPRSEVRDSGDGSRARAERAPAAATPGRPEPHFDYRRHLVEYAGPGPEEVPEIGTPEVRIGWFGPADPAHPTGGAMWEGALLAIEERNARGGAGGRPFRLLPKWSENPWGTGIQGVAELVFRERVCVVLGAPDSASAHLVEQIVAKAHVPFVNAVATEKSLNYVNLPWIFSLPPADPEIAAAIARELASSLEDAPEDVGERRLALVSTDDHDSRQLARDILSAFGRTRAFPGRHAQLRAGEPDLAQALAPLVEWGPTTVLVLAGPLDSARIAQALRETGARLVFGPQAGRRAFLEELRSEDRADGPGAQPGLGAEPERTAPPIRGSFPVLWAADSAGEGARAFAARFRERFGRDPDYAAAYAYDAVNLVAAAVERAGLHRVRIRDALRELTPFAGVTGTIEWDPTARRRGVPIAMETFRE